MPIINSPRDYQIKALLDINEQWSSGHRVVCCVAPTGAGKTVIKAFAVKDYIAANPGKMAVIFAHRDVLLSQISTTLAKCGIPHKMICSAATEKNIAQEHLLEVGESYLSRESRVIVASVKTWIGRNISYLVPHIGLWCMDEYHHTVQGNTWGQAVEPLDNAGALGLGVTATPHRADKQGLGRHASGYSDALVKTPGMGQLIAMGNLSAYKVYSIPERFNTDGINITSSGDLNQKKLAKRTHMAMDSIIGDSVREYQRLANGKQAIIFSDSVEHAELVADKYRLHGIKAEALSSKTHESIRQRKVREFRTGELTVLVNYDLFGEGFDVPAVEVVVMLRKTMSYGLFKQMFGRCLRVIDGKTHGILIDHVGNVPYFLSTELYGKYLHDDPEWTLDDQKDLRKDDGLIEVITRRCPKCMRMYHPASKNPRSYICPNEECGHRETATEISHAARKVMEKEGTLIEMDTSYLSDIMPKIKEVDEPIESFSRRINYSPMPDVAKNSAIKRHSERQANQKTLRELIGQWCHETAQIMQYDVVTTQAEFNKQFGVDVFKAQTLGSGDAEKLRQRVAQSISELILDCFI